MPNAGEGANLAYNLAVLGRLGGLPLGTKLKFDAATNRFDVDDRFLITRTFSRDSVTSETHFATPMRDLVQQAARQAGTPAVTQAVFDAAVRGLARLRMTYTSKPAKVTALDNILKTVAGLVQRVREAVIDVAAGDLGGHLADVVRGLPHRDAAADAVVVREVFRERQDGQAQ